MAGITEKPKLIMREGDVTSGALEANDAYDLKLYRMPNGALELEVFMKIQFFFENGPGGEWSGDEKMKFMKDWEIAVKTAWSGRNILLLKFGKPIAVRLKFAIQEGGWMADHWEISVTKIKSGSFRTSYVNVSWGNVVLDSEDLMKIPKGHGQMQSGAVHEFGHMLGLSDEYQKTHKHRMDYSSVMNSGMAIRQRHITNLRSWLEKRLKILGIE